MSPVTCHLFSVTWVSWLSKITENYIFHGNFSVEITYKVAQKRLFLTEQDFVTETNYCITKTVCDRSKVSLQKQVYFTETSLFPTKSDKSKFSLQKQVHFTEKSLFPKQVLVRGKISLRKPVSITETNFCPSLFQRNTLLSQKKVLVAEKLLP